MPRYEYIYEIVKDADGVDCFVKRGDIVRCQDCEWYKMHYTWDGKERKVCGIEPFEPIRRGEDYCSYGERSER